MRSLFVLAAAIGAALLGACRDTKHLSLSSLEGKWSNEDPATRGLDTVAVRVQGTTVLVSVWGACTPFDCYWGETPADASAWESEGLLRVTWNPWFAVETQTWSLPATSRLEVKTFTHFTDNSGRADYQEIDDFRRAP